jgi:hypothetical protein
VSIGADYISLLDSCGHSVDDIISLAMAMERGPDRDAIYSLEADCYANDLDDEAVVAAVLHLAQAINQANIQKKPLDHGAGSGSKSRCGNRERRGLTSAKWRALRAQIFERDGHACTYCGDVENLCCDHILPLIQGGSNDPENLTTACRTCNSSKGGKTVEAWVMA